MDVHSHADSEQVPASQPAIRYIAKKPILDANEHVFGYELLFRDGPESVFSNVDCNQASLSTMDYSLAFGTGTVAGEKLAFANCTRELLVTHVVTLLPPDKTVLEILEDIAPDPEVLEACRHLRSLGYRLAIDDFLESNLASPFLDLVTFVKVDIRGNPKDAQARIAQELGRRRLQLVAEKVETRDEFEFLRAQRYRHFQGYYFCRPIILQSQDIPAAQLHRLRLLRTISDPSLNLKEVEEMIRLDVSLSYRLLRYLNSAAFGLYRVRSAMHALTLLGEHEVRKWVALVTAGMLAQGKTPELVRIAVVGAKFCERFAPPGASEQYFLTGLFSLLDAMLDRPMSQLVSELPVSGECRTALLWGENSLARLLQQCKRFERGEFSCADTYDPESIYHSFRDATLWADAVFEAQ